MRLFIVCLLIIPNLLLAQKEFSALNNTWRYELHSFDCSNYYLRYNVEKEVEIDGKDCSIIYAYTSRNFSPFTRTDDSLIVWENDNKVYFYQFNDFHLVYDFNLEVGDTLEYFLPTGKTYFSPYEEEVNDTAVIATSLYVDDIGILNINGTIYKVFETRITNPEDGLYHSMDRIVEKVGSNNAQILGHNQAVVASGCGPSFLCFESENYSYPPDEMCEFPTSTKNIYTDNEIRFYPNPTFGDLTIENNTPEEIKSLEVINMNGQRVARFNIVNSSLQLDNISKGFYVIKMTFDSGITHIDRLVKY